MRKYRTKENTSMGINTEDVPKPLNNRVLIIDDNLTNWAMLEDMLRANGYETRYAPDGIKGLDAVRVWNPSVVLLDLVMPVMGGMEVCRRIREEKLPKRPSIIVVSIKGDKKTVIDSLVCGADDFIVKPVNETELVARVRAQSRICDFYAEMEEDKKRLEKIVDITSAISSTLDIKEVFNIIVTKVAEATDAVRCSIMLIVKENEGYVLASHDNPGLKELRLDLSRYPEIKEVISTKCPLALNDMLNHPLMKEVREYIKGLKDMSLLVVPIVFNDEVLGTLCLRSHRKNMGFTGKEIDFCRIVANASFHALKNAKLFDKVTREKEFLKEISVKDHLTALYNHNYFYTRLEEEFDRAVRYEAPLSLIMMDIDDFKRINDLYGHRVGDNVLKELAALIKRGVRKTDIVSRYGGEEFSVILPHTMLKGALDEAERMRSLIECHTYAGLIKEKITMSLGVASFPTKGVMNSGDLVNMADNALYKAKAGGRNRVFGDGG